MSMIEVALKTQLEQVQIGYGHASDKIEAEQWAARLFEKEHKEARWSRLWSWLLRSESKLLYLHPAAPTRQMDSSERQSVPLAHIKGSCGGRVNDFDTRFRPRQRHNRDRWQSIAVAFRLQRPLPPVELVKVDEIYFVVDGHHRLSVAGGAGLKEIDANVTELQLV
jgi:hypothetical protein